MLTDIGKTELGPSLQWVIQGLHQPGDTVNSLIEFRKLGHASAGDDGAHSKTAQESHLTTSFGIRSHCLSQPNPLSFLSAAIVTNSMGPPLGRWPVSAVLKSRSTKLTVAQIRVARRVRVPE